MKYRLPWITSRSQSLKAEMLACHHAASPTRDSAFQTWISILTTYLTGRLYSYGFRHHEAAPEVNTQWVRNKMNRFSSLSMLR